MMGETPHFSPSSPPSRSSATDFLVDHSDPEASCPHTKTRSVKTYGGNFMTLKILCESCGRIVDEENVLMGLERLRCPVDPRLDRCMISCPVEDGSVSVFENPCEPVMTAMETYLFVPIKPPRLLEQESPEK